MAAFNFSTGVMELGTLASGSVIFALTNPATAAGATPKPLLIKRVSIRTGFSGVAAATRINLALNRATGTAAGGTSSAATTGIPHRRGSGKSDDSISTLRWGPAAVTGLTDATPEGLIKASMVNHQNGPMVWDELIEDVKELEETDPLEIQPGTSLVLRTGGASASVAGTAVAVDIEWTEK